MQVSKGLLDDTPTENILKPTDGRIVDSGDAWKYALGISEPDASWNSLSPKSINWSEGNTPLGWSDTPLKTKIERGNERPLVLYARKEVTINRLETVKNLVLITYADDGIIVYVNGREVARENVHSGNVDHKTWATTATKTTDAVKSPIVVNVSPDTLREGTNVISVSVHGNYRGTQSLSFDVTADVVSK